MYKSTPHVLSSVLVIKRQTYTWKYIYICTKSAPLRFPSQTRLCPCRPWHQPLCRTSSPVLLLLQTSSFYAAKCNAGTLAMNARNDFFLHWKTQCKKMSYLIYTLYICFTRTRLYVLCYYCHPLVYCIIHLGKVLIVFQIPVERLCP